MLAFVLANVLYMAVARAGGFPFFRPETWSHWDSGLYIEIAKHGYNFFSCARIHLYAPTDWCGNTGWFPGFPALMWPLIHAGLSPEGAGVLISSLFEMAFLALLWVGFLDARVTARNLLVLGTASFFAGQIYYHAVFPISQEVFFSFLLILYVARERWLAAGLAGAAASVSYATGFLWIPVTAVWIVVAARRAPWFERLRRVAITSGMTAVGFGFVIAVQKMMTGVWGAFFKVQSKYGYHLQNPVSTFWSKVHPLFDGTFQLDKIPLLQTLVVALYILGMTVLVVAARKRLTRVDTLAYLGAVAFWVFPFFLGGTASLYRTEALLVPSVVLIRHLPFPSALAVFIGGVAIAYPMALLFFRGVLV